MKRVRHSSAGLVVALVVLVVASAGCTTSRGSPAQQLRSWESGASYGDNASLIATDVSEIAAGIRTGPLGALHTACDGLGYDAGNAYGELPTPDQTLTDELNDEYVDLTNAAQACSEARALRGTAITRYRGLLAKANTALAAAKARVATILSS